MHTFHCNTQSCRGFFVTDGCTWICFATPTIFLLTGSVANIRSHLAAAVPISDQILLLGPPYKVPKDSTLQSEEVLNSLRLGDAEDNPIPEEAVDSAQFANSSKQAGTRRSLLTSTERSGARRLFLFSKRALSENAPDPPPCKLEPMELALPTDPPGTSTLNLTQSISASQPLHQALVAYDRQFMLYLAQGRVLADGADMRLRSCRQCVQEQAIMARALRAAVSNLSDHFNGASRTRSDFTATFQSKISSHTSLLQKFESILANLGSVPLHPSLIQIARGSGRIMETLLDTVPVERERAWAQQCQTSHQHLLSLYNNLESAFSQLGTPSSRDEEIRQDSLAEGEIQALSNEVEAACQNIRDKQAERLKLLTDDHNKALKLIMDALGEDASSGAQDDKVQNTFTPLHQMSNKSKEVVQAMETDDKEFQKLLQKVSEAKTAVMKRMKVRLREVSVAQSSIQRVLSSIGVLKDALNHQCDNMIHLEHVAELTTSYKDFLSELKRRKAYGQAVASSSTAMMERLALMRSDEVKAREKFLRGPGRHLMPPFFEIFVPTLATPPPLFTPQVPALIEMEMLPDVANLVSEDADTSMMGGQEGGISSASSLTAESIQQQTAHSTADKNFHSSNTEEQVSNNNAGVPAAHPNDHLIVSADEQSANDDVIMDQMTGVSEEAERKTLAYENEMLRQQIERLGGKAPKAYLDGPVPKVATTATAAVVSSSLKEMESLRKELEVVKSRAEKAEKALSTQELSDKISHSSFSIGDVALFMPTGRESGGKRTYLAFHTSCPHRYLSTDNIEGNPDFVLGRIVYQEVLLAEDANAFGLQKGTRYHLLTVEVLKAT